MTTPDIKQLANCIEGRAIGSKAMNEGDRVIVRLTDGTTFTGSIRSIRGCEVIVQFDDKTIDARRNMNLFPPATCIPCLRVPVPNQGRPNRRTARHCLTKSRPTAQRQAHSPLSPCAKALPPQISRSIRKGIPSATLGIPGSVFDQCTSLCGMLSGVHWSRRSCPCRSLLGKKLTLFAVDSPAKTYPSQGRHTGTTQTTASEEPQIANGTDGGSV